jgi:predicted permease
MRSGHSPARPQSRWRTRRWLEDAWRDVRYACRSSLRAPLTPATIIATVGLGLGLVTAAFTILSFIVFRVDEVRNPYELFGVEREQSGAARVESFTLDRYATLMRETDVFTAAFASTADVAAQIDGARRDGRLVTGNFFEVLGVGAMRGRTLTVSDDEAGRPPVIVLSYRAWVQHFRSDPGVLQATYRVNTTTFQVVGVMPEGFRGLEIVAPDFWAPIAHVDLFPEQGARGPARTRLGDDLNVVGRLKPTLTSEQAQARLAAWDTQHTAERSRDEAAAKLVLTSRPGTLPQPAEAILAFTPLFFAFGLILLIGCANVASLLLARLVARQREIGIRLAIGASRRRIVWQLLTENLLLAVLASAVGFVVSRLVLRGIVYAIITSFPPEIGNLRIETPAADWRVGVFLLAGALVSTVLFALIPSLRTARAEVARALYGHTARGRSRRRARNVLLTLQVTGSVLLLTCAATFLRSAWVAANADPGFRVANVVNVSVLNEQRREALLAAVHSEAAVASVAASWPGWFGGIAGAPAYASGATGKSVVGYQYVSPEFFDVLDIAVVRGRGFTAAERSPNEGVAVVSESVAGQLWPDAEAIGQVLRVEPDPTILRPGQSAPAVALPPANDPMRAARTAVVIGVARDVAGLRIDGTKLGDTGVYMPVSAEGVGTVLIARVREDAELARHKLIERIAAIDTNMAQVATLETFTRAESYMLAMLFWLTLALGALALLLTLSGLFSVLSYLVAQRTPEIGVRMALGASRSSIGALILLQSSRPVGIGVSIGTTLTAGVSAALLATPAAEQISTTVHLFDPLAYGASLLCVLGACAGAALFPARRAVRINPLAALRQD